MTEFIGPKGRIKFTSVNHRIDYREEGDLIEYYSYPGHYEIINIKDEFTSATIQFQDLIQYIEKDKNPLPLLENAYKSLEVVLAGDKAIKTGQIIKIS